MRFGTGVLLFFAVVALNIGNAVADSNEPLLLKPPYPAGFIPPQPHFDGKLPVRSTEPVPVFCIVFDVGKDGMVSNLRILQSTGTSKADDVIVKWYEKRQYDSATLNGAPVAVRMIGRYIAGPSPLNDNCTWDFYETQAASLPPASPQP